MERGPKEIKIDEEDMGLAEGRWSAQERTMYLAPWVLDEEEDESEAGHSGYVIAHEMGHSIMEHGSPSAPPTEKDLQSEFEAALWAAARRGSIIYVLDDIDQIMEFWKPAGLDEADTSRVFARAIDAVNRRGRASRYRLPKRKLLNWFKLSNEDAPQSYWDLGGFFARLD